MLPLARFLLLCSPLLMVLHAHSAVAQYDTEDDSPTASVSVPAATASNLGVRITQLEERMRVLQGALEEAHFRNKKLQEMMAKTQQDNDFRFKDLEAKLAASHAAVTANATANSAPPAAPHDGKDAMDVNAIEAAAKPDSPTKKPVNEAPSPEESKVAAAKEDPKTDSAKGSATEQYNQAFRLLNQSKYDESRAAFKEFIAKNPKSPLVSNAYYWMGETYYVKRDYVQSADAFRQGYEANSKGTKAADNLLKLSMSLSALKRKDEACIVLKQVVQEYEKKNMTATNKAKAEITRLECAE